MFFFYYYYDGNHIFFLLIFFRVESHRNTENEKVSTVFLTRQSAIQLLFSAQDAFRTDEWHW